jgi:hypothetical protein
MGGAPRRIATPMTIMVTYLRTAFATASPVVASVILIVREVRGAVVLGASQDVVLIGFIITAFDAISGLVERSLEPTANDSGYR